MDNTSLSFKRLSKALDCPNYEANTRKDKVDKCLTGRRESFTIQEERGRWHGKDKT